jgi:tRNA 2-thiouridine synthesizing protein A
MAKVVDARGLSCPQPVLLARKAMEEGEFPIEVLVDTGTSRDNVTRVAQKAGLKVKVEEREGGFVVRIEK